MRKQLIQDLALAALLAAAGSVMAQSTLFVTPDVPTAPDGPADYLPWEVVRHVTGGTPYAVELVLPGQPAINALHKMDAAHNWLFSVEAPNDLGGSGFTAEPRDVVRWNGETASLFLDGSCLARPLPADADINALTQNSGLGDAGSLLAAFAAPTTAGAATFGPSHLVRFARTGTGPCNWKLAGSFDLAALSASYLPLSARITGLDSFDSSTLVVVFDVPVDLAPSHGPTTYLSGQVAIYEMGSTWGVIEDLRTVGTPGWPLSSETDGLSFEANPGQPTGQIRLGKSGAEITVECPASCSSGGTRSGLYRGNLFAVRAGTYDHAKVSCAESCPGTFAVNPGSGDHYYLLVSGNEWQEGSYGATSFGERPRAALEADRCVPYQMSAQCPTKTGG